MHIRCADGEATDAQPPAQNTVISADGLLELTIPPGALPEGVALSDLSATTISVAETLSDEEAASEGGNASRIIAHFELEPSGLRFLQPVTLTFRLPSRIVTGPLVVLHAFEEGAEPLAITPMDRPESEEVELTATIEHFSSVFIVHALIPHSDVISAKVKAPVYRSWFLGHIARGNHAAAPVRGESASRTAAGVRWPCRSTSQCWL